MDTDVDVSVLKPGYMSWNSFITFLDTLRSDGVPTYIDSSVLHGMSGTAKSQLRLTLQFLGFIDKEGRTQDELSQLANADPEGRKKIVQDILKEKYDFLFIPTDDFDLENSSPTKFSEKFANFGLSGDTKTKAEAFFLNAAKFSDIKISKYITQNRGTRKRKSGSKSRTANEQIGPKATGREAPSGSGISEGQTDTNLLNSQFGLLYKLQIERLPKSGKWTTMQRDQYLKAYTAILNLVISTTDTTETKSEEGGD